jgi:hypothetical protein
MNLNYISDKIKNYFEAREAERFEEFMQDVRIGSAYVLSQGENIRKIHESPDAWRINN